MTPCELCKGACCESIILPFRFGGRDKLDAERWMRYHAEQHDLGWLIHVPCNKLKDGRCSIYATRPDVCVKFAVGSPMCLDAIARNRKENAEEIRRMIENADSDTDSKDG